jgi:HEAT repeat protein
METLSPPYNDKSMTFFLEALFLVLLFHRGGYPVRKAPGPVESLRSSEALSLELYRSTHPNQSPHAERDRRDGIEDFIHQWRSEQAAIRDQATLGLLSRWKEWSDADLAKVKRAAGDEDPEVAGRAGQALDRIEVRRTLLGTDLETVRGIEDAVCLGRKEDQLSVLGEAAGLWLRKKLRERDLLVLAQWAVKRKWTIESGELMGVAELPYGPHGESRSVTPYAELVAPHLKSPDAKTRAWAAGFVGGTGQRTYSAPVAVLLKDEDGHVRAMAAWALGWLGGSDAPDLIVPLLEDQEPEVRRRSINSLAHLGDQGHRSQIALQLSDLDPGVRAAAAETLGILRAREYGENIAALLQGGKDDQAQFAAVIALGVLGAHDHAMEVVPLLKSKDWVRRLEATKALARMGAREHGRDLVPLLKDEDLRVLWESAEALARLGVAEEIDTITSLLKDARPWNRAVAARTLGMLGAREKRKDILPLLGDAKSWVRRDAVTALGRLGGKDYREEVFRVLDDEDPYYVRTAAALALARLGEAGITPEEKARWLEKLDRMRHDPLREVKEAASIALVRLSPPDRNLHLEVLEMLASSPGSDHFREYTKVLMQLYEKDAFERLTLEALIGHPIESWEDLEAFLQTGGLRIKRDPSLKICGRVSAGVRANAGQVIRWIFAEDDRVQVIEGDVAILMKGEETLVYWRRRLEPR